MSPSRCVLTAALGLLASAPALADDSPRKVGGHLGLALPIASMSGGTAIVGRDFTSLGLSQGVTVHIDERWAVDYELVGYLSVQGTGNSTVLVVDPGVLYKMDGLITGLRAAMRIADQTNFGIVPIVVKPFDIGGVAWFAELDLPVFLNETTDPVTGATELQPALTVQLQTGIGF